ncbi:MAG: ABC-type transport auxiliary lipoprotein family protein [Fibrobacterota bacterium]
MGRFLIPALLVFLAGCSAPKNLTEQIILYFEPVLADTSVKPPAAGYPFRVQVKEIELDPLYDNANVVIRNTDWSVQFSKRGVWAVRPNTSATDLLGATLKGRLPCRALKKRFPDSSPDYVISGTLNAVEEDRRSNTFAARLALTLSIVRYTDSKTLFERTYRQSKAVSDTGYVGIAKALSYGLKAACNEFAGDAIRVFNRELEVVDAQGSGKN